MIFLLNFERVRFEVIELTRLRIAQVLHLSPSDVEVTYERGEDGQVSRGWALKNLPTGLSPEAAQESAIQVVRWLTANYLLPRLKDAARTAGEARAAQEA